jgi:adenine-specific DNA-methyltransferase
MKYMGSKRTMLSNGLGEMLRAHVGEVHRFVDLFAGSSAVSWFVAENSKCEVIAGDLQAFAVALAEAVISREDELNPDPIWRTWSRDAACWLAGNSVYRAAEVFETRKWSSARRRNVEEARKISSESPELITQAYGGHYFSPKQSLVLDSLRATLPTDSPEHTVALAALICAASECAASPGHTAQPFQPTQGAAKFLFEAWRRDILDHVERALKNICPRHARRAGYGMISDAQTLAEQLCDDDLAFIDPPYSGVHYSRFYHVLETIARGSGVTVSGIGRYPSPNQRPKSDFSVKSKSKLALDKLFSALGKKKVKTIVTFPREETSNGLSGSYVQTVAERYFAVSKKVVNGRFSTLGGNLENRRARVPAYEIILLMSPRN